MYKTQEQLEKLAARPDLDTICAYDYQRMKNYALSGEGLNVNDWHPELRGIKEVPKMNWIEQKSYRPLHWDSKIITILNKLWLRRIALTTCMMVVKYHTLIEPQLVI